MQLRGEILRHLLAASDLPPEHWLDLTADKIGASWLRKHGMPGDVSPRAPTYGLVIADAEARDLAQAHLDPEGSLLLFEPSRVAAARPRGLLECSRVRTNSGAWVLYRHLPRPARPLVSIVIVCQDQLGILYELLVRLAEEPDSPKWEGLIIDRGSLDATTELIGRCSGDLRAWRTPRDATIEQAMNYGIRRANGRLIISLDPGDSPSTGFIRRTWDKHRANQRVPGNRRVIRSRSQRPYDD